MLISATEVQLSLYSLKRVDSYPTYCGEEILAVVLRRTAKIAKPANLQGFYFWFKLSSVATQYQSVCTADSPARTVICVGIAEHCASSSLIFQFSVSVIYRLLFSGHLLSHRFYISLPYYRVHLPELIQYFRIATAFTQPAPSTLTVLST